MRKSGCLRVITLLGGIAFGIFSVGTLLQLLKIVPVNGDNTGNDLVWLFVYVAVSFLCFFSFVRASRKARHLATVEQQHLAAARAQKRATPVNNLPPTQKVDSVVFRPTPAAPVRPATPKTEKMGGSLSRLGNYRLIRLLGEGGFAEVYLGEHIHLNTQAAIKVLHAQLANEDIETFRTEARTVARLIHPHIIRVLDFDVEGKIPFLVMDYAPLGTLRKAHPRGTALPLSTIVSYVKQVAEALQYAHDEKLIHRDVKPENMLIGRRNEVLLSDFGIAVVVHNTYSQKAQGMTGTVAYMAPEQILEYPRQASDQYSLGIVVYEWLTGNIPFQGSPPEIAVKHMTVAPPPLRQKVPTISSAVERVVLKALAKEPKDRFESVRAFAAALERATMV